MIVDQPTPDRPACDGHWPLYWGLIETPGNAFLRREAADICGTCPLRDKCLATPASEDPHWHEAARGIVKILIRQKEAAA